MFPESVYRILVFNPTNPRDRYNLFDDLTGLTAIWELAASLVPAGEGDTRAIDVGARDVLDGVVSYLKAAGQPVSLPAIRAFLAEFSDEHKLIRRLAATLDPDVRDIAFALARSGKKARFLRYDDIRRSIQTSDFSLDAFLDKDRVANEGPKSIVKVADLHPLKVGQAVAAYRGEEWPNRASPYFESIG